jgi:hypothetical protein
MLPNPDSCYFFEDEKDSSYRVYRLFQSTILPAWLFGGRRFILNRQAGRLHHKGDGIE